MALEVLVAGGGLGGLCLAQGLRRTGVRARVFERDSTPDTRGQGYRLRIDPDGIAALSQCLSEELFELFQATTNAPRPPRGLAFDHHLNQVASFGESLAGDERRRLSTVANRRTLREILLAGLGVAGSGDDVTVEFGADVVAAEETAENRVTVHLANGRAVTGDVLVASDGIGSVLRTQRLPHAELLDTGLRGIYGHAILDDYLRDVLPDALRSGSPPILGPDGVTLAIGVYSPCETPQRAAMRLAPYARLSHVADYVKWTLVAQPAALGLSEAEVWTACPQALYDIARRITADWHPALVELVRCADPPSTFAVAIRAALPVAPWPSSRITLLGDAIHATTPAGGTGANVALRDAALLTDMLTATDQGRLPVLDAIAGYEEQMREYGFAASTRSLRSAELIFRARLPALV
jgi:2-polyprenyl-6-methoxyphenol hydroxylase-like FAD-dependent oxidoreductase